MKFTSKKILTGGLVGGMLMLCVAAPTFFTSCDNAMPEIEITLTSDYSSILNAITNSSKSLSEKLALIEQTIDEGKIGNQQAIELVQAALRAMQGSLEDRLAAIETIIGNQSSEFSSKLLLIEAAVNEGFADSAKQEELLQKAVESLTGTVEEKLAAVETAINSQVSELSDKLALVEAAVNAGFADEVTALGLIGEAVGSLDTALSDGLKAVGDSLSVRIDSLVTAFASQGGATQAQIDDINTAIDAISAAIDTLAATNYSEILEVIHTEVIKLCLPAGCLKNFFSVSDSTKVCFSKGNLYYDGTKFNFEKLQYVSSPSIDSNRDPSHISHFFWSKSSAVALAEDFSDPTSSSDDVLFTNAPDFTVNEVTGRYRSLSIDEWKYLLTAAPSGRGNGDRYFKINVHFKTGLSDSAATNCLVIAPDGNTEDIKDEYDIASWAEAEAKGFVCLPYAGFRTFEGIAGTLRVNGITSYGDYLSSTRGWDSFYGLDISATGTNLNGEFEPYFPFKFAFSVRLVTDAK